MALSDRNEAVSATPFLIAVSVLHAVALFGCLCKPHTKHEHVVAVIYTVFLCWAGFLLFA